MEDKNVMNVMLGGQFPKELPESNLWCGVDKGALYLIDNGIKAIWNFAHIDLDAPEDVMVENVHLSESLMTLSYNLSEYRKEHEGM